MLYTRYTSVRAFADEVTAVLDRHEIQNNLLFHNINLGLASEERTGLVMATVKDAEGAILLTVVQTPPHPLVFYETQNKPNDAALDCLVGGLAGDGISVDTFAAEKDLASRFNRIFSEHTKKVFYNNQNLVLYVLEHAHEQPAPPGQFRPVSRQDLYYLPYWLADFAPACHIGEYNLDQGYRIAESMITGGTGFIWEDAAGLPVSLAANNRHTANCAIIGYVYTPPHLRGHGYSTACVYELSRKLLAEGWMFCALYADCANPYSNRVYQKIGYREVLFYDEYRVVSGQFIP